MRRASVLLLGLALAGCGSGGASDLEGRSFRSSFSRNAIFHAM